MTIIILKHTNIFMRMFTTTTTTTAAGPASSFACFERK